jgi:hypothetical protein
MSHFTRIIVIIIRKFYDATKSTDATNNQETIGTKNQFEYFIELVKSVEPKRLLKTSLEKSIEQVHPVGVERIKFYSSDFLQNALQSVG